MTVVQQQLGRRLRKLRDAAGKSDSHVEASGIASRVKLWRIETAKVAAKVGDVRGLCWLYGADDLTTDMLAHWALAGKQPGWWEDFDEPLSTRDGLYAGLEASAQHLTIFESRQVPGLLQTPDYSRAVYLAVATEPAVDDYVQHIQERQTAMAQRIPPVRLTAVLDEGILTRPVGGPDTLREQIRLLKELADHVHIDIRYIPWQAGAHPAMYTGGFTVLDFTDPVKPDVVYIEAHTGARYLELPTELTEYRRVFADAYGRSVPISAHR